MKKLLEEGEPTKSWKTKKPMRWPWMRIKWDRGREGKFERQKSAYRPWRQIELISHLHFMMGGFHEQSSRLCWIASPAPDVVGHEILKWNPRRKQKRLHFQEELLRYNRIHIHTYIYIYIINENIVHGEWIQLSRCSVESHSRFLTNSINAHFMHQGRHSTLRLFTYWPTLILRKFYKCTVMYQEASYSYHKSPEIERKNERKNLMEPQISHRQPLLGITGFASCAK